MIHSLILTPSQAGPNDWVKAKLQGNSLDFRQINLGLFIVFIQPNHIPSTSLYQPYQRLPNVRVINEDEIEFQIPNVIKGISFPNPGGNIPPDRYRVIFRYSFWEGRGSPDIEVISTSVPRSVGQQIIGTILNVGNSIQLLPSILQNQAINLRNRISINAAITNNSSGIFLNFLANILPGVPSPVGHLQHISLPSAFDSVKPLSDGEKVFPEIADLINNSQQWFYLATWGFDEETRFNGGSGQNTYSNVAVNLIKQAATNIFNTGVQPDFKILVWSNTLDANDFEGNDNKIGQLGVVSVNWGRISRMKNGQFLKYIRSQNCVEKDGLILDFFSRYKRMNSLTSSSKVYFPSGIHVMVVKHPTNPRYGSHHQKFIVTEKAGYIGGLNFQKQYWDSNRHLFNDNRRASSSSGLGSAAGSPCGLHDTGSIIKGDRLLQLVLRRFVLRWDDLVVERGSYHYLYNLLCEQENEPFLSSTDSSHLNYLRKKIKSLRPLLFDRQIRQGANYNTIPDPLFRADKAHTAVSLPSGMVGSTPSGIIDIKREYERSLAQLIGSESFMYLETQYFEDYDLTKKIFESYRQASGQREFQYAYIVIPYKPETVWLDIFGWFSRDEIIKAEAKNLKWLEIKSARRIYLKDSNTGKWYPKWDVEQPHKNVWFGSYVAGPRDVKEDSEFIVRNAIELDQNGNALGNPPVVQQSFKVKNVMTDSEIMAYTLVCHEEQTIGGIQDISVSLTGTPQDRFRKFLGGYGIYIHSKCTLFLNGEEGFWGTIGSANFNPRSMEDNGNQDSEMNVFWKSKKTVEGFCETLWKEHANLDSIDYYEWARRGNENFNTIMNGTGNLNSSLVRLDVWDRMEDLV